MSYYADVRYLDDLRRGQATVPNREDMEPSVVLERLRKSGREIRQWIQCVLP